jgi:hypothetical protein
MNQRIEFRTSKLLLSKEFSSSRKFMEQELSKPMLRENSAGQILPEQLMSFPLKISMGGLDSMGNLLQHNPQQTDAPPLPPEVLNRIALLCKSMSLDESANLPEAEPHCNCVHCQIARAMHQNLDNLADASAQDEEVTAEDLKFRSWDIQQTGDKLYLVSTAQQKRALASRNHKLLRRKATAFNRPHS